jgi:hypothetical protein
LADHEETALFRGSFTPAHVGITVALLLSGRVVCSDVQNVDLARQMAVFVSALAGVATGQRTRLMCRMIACGALGSAQGWSHA